MNWFKRLFQGSAKPVDARPGEGSVTVRNRLPAVAVALSAEETVIQYPPALKCSLKTATGAQIRQWAAANDLELSFGIDPDMHFGQIESQSAIEACLWLKRFNADTGYTYKEEWRDCDNFARRFRAFPDIFSCGPISAQAAVFGIYATMQHPFAGITDGVHALNSVWTDAGVFVFEPQGLDLVYQRLEDWPNRHGISAVLMD